MGGKSYYCDYCDNHMKNDIKVRKKHIDGLPHKIAKANYMAKFRDPKEILLTESQKGPCTRFHLNGHCKFGLFCHFSHYTKDDLTKLENLADTTTNLDKICVNKPLLNKANFIHLPQSLQPYDVTDIQIIHSAWGD